MSAARRSTAVRSRRGAVAPAEDRRFRRAQARPAARRRRERWRRALSVARVSALVLGLVLCGLYVWRTLPDASFLRVQAIEVRGTAHVSSGEALAILEGLRGQPLLRADLEAWRARLQSSAWVKQATLHRVLPSTIEVDIVERVPVAIGRDGDRLFLVDSTGTVIDEFGPRYGDFDLPLVDGLIETGARDSAAHAQRAALGARVLAAFAAERDVLDRVSQIDVRDPRNAIVLLEDDEARLRLGDRAFVERVRSYLELAPALRSDAAVLDYVDLRFDARVFVRPSPEAVRARAAATTSDAPAAAGGTGAGPRDAAFD